MKARSLGYSQLPELEVQGASPPRSPAVGAAEVSGLLDDPRRTSSPQAIPGLPLIEIRRPSALSQFEFGYFVNELAGSGSASESDCAPLLLTGVVGGNVVEGAVGMNSRKSSNGALARTNVHHVCI